MKKVIYPGFVPCAIEGGCMATVIVTGVARSGTSMATGILGCIGVPLEMSPLVYSTQNPKGGFESKKVNLLSLDIASFLEENSVEQAMLYFEPEIRSLSSDADEIRGFKCGLLRHVWRVMLPFLHEPHVISVSRDFEPHVASWMIHMRDHFGENVDRYYAEEKIGKESSACLKMRQEITCPILNLTYDGLKNSPYYQAKRIAMFLQIELPTDIENRLKDFILPDYTTLRGL